MTTLNQTFPFSQQFVDLAPSQNGVYLLYQSEALTYIGRAAGLFVTIRSRLQSHLRGDEGLCTYYATHFGYQVTPNPVAMEEALLREYFSVAGRLPRCNDRIG